METACPVCGTGAVGLDPLRYPISHSPIPQAKLPNKVFVTLNFELIVPENVAHQIKSICPETMVSHSSTPLGPVVTTERIAPRLRV